MNHDTHETHRFEPITTHRLDPFANAPRAVARSARVLAPRIAFVCALSSVLVACGGPAVDSDGGDTGARDVAQNTDVRGDQTLPSDVPPPDDGVSDAADVVDAAQPDVIDEQAPDADGVDAVDAPIADDVVVDGAADTGSDGAIDAATDTGSDSGSVFALSTPTDVAASDGAYPDRVEVTWTAVVGAERYEISVDGGPWVDAGTGTSFVDSAAPGGTFVAPVPTASDGTRTDAVDLAIGTVTLVPAPARDYRVRAVSTAGLSDASLADSGYRASAEPISIQWQRSADDSPSGFTDLAGITTAMAADSTAPLNSEGRYYRVVLTAVGAAPFATASDRGYRILPAPTNVQASDGTDTGGVFVTWDAVPGATGYEVYDGTTWNAAGATPGWRDANAPMGRVTFDPVTASDGTFLTHVDLETAPPRAEPGTPRTYRVRALGPSGPGLESSSDDGYRGVGGSFQVSLQRSLADSDMNFVAITSPYAITGGTMWRLRDYRPDVPIGPDGRYYRFEVALAGVPNFVSPSDRGFVRARGPVLTYTIRARTGTVANAGTDDCMYAQFGDEFSTSRMALNSPVNDFESGDTNTFTFSAADLGNRPCLSIDLDDCDGTTGFDGWYGIDVVLSDTTGRSWTYTLNRWLDDASGRSTGAYVCPP